MIQLQNIDVRSDAKTIVSGISFEAKKGEVTMIAGANGSGKTTILSCIAGLRKVASGNILIDGTPIETIPSRVLAKQRAVLAQHNVSAFPITVEEMVMMGRYPHFEFNPRQIDKEIVGNMLQLFDLLPFRNRNYLSLSGGERQRVHFARVMAQLDGQENALLLLDEPLTFLDLSNQITFLRTLRRLVDEHGITVIGVLHDLNLVMQFADYLVLLKEGTLIRKGSPQSLLNPESIQEVFDVEVQVHSFNNLNRIIYPV